jgi:hypothetical protein
MATFTVTAVRTSDPNTDGPVEETQSLPASVNTDLEGRKIFARVSSEILRRFTTIGIVSWLINFGLPQTGGPGSRIYFPQEQVSPVIPPGIGSVLFVYIIFLTVEAEVEVKLHRRRVLVPGSHLELVAKFFSDNCGFLDVRRPL